VSDDRRPKHRDFGRRTPPGGVPAYVDPASEPSAAVLIGKQMDVLAERFDRLDNSVSTWASESVRHNEQIKALSTSIGAVVAYTESIRTSSATQAAQLSHFFDREWPRHGALMERFEKALDNVADRLTRLEQAVERLHSSDQALAARLTANEACVNSLDVRITALERSGRDQAVEVAVKQKISGKAGAALVGAGGAIAFVVERLLG
jgi:chaperonin cofactor prefoldin